MQMRYALSFGKRYLQLALTAMKTIDKRGPHEDRRLDDIGPPEGWRDRRKRVERRIPKSHEVEVSDAEWAEYFANPAKKAAEQEHADIADILDRVRN